jgi:release factor glutamine methyltransferase
MKARDAFRTAKDTLIRFGIPEPEAKAKVIVSHALGAGFSEACSDIEVSEKELKLTGTMTDRCAKGEPVEYITGRAYFRYLTLEVNPSVLIPRKETELAAQMAIELIKERRYSNALDMCTGSGCIAISLATEAGIAVTAGDISEDALKIAQRNAEINGAADISFICGDMFDNIEGKFDVIVSNPPYVSEEEYKQLDKEIRLYEPGVALIAGDGLKFYRVLAAKSSKHLNPGGSLVLEIGCSQAQGVTALLISGGFTGIKCFKDYEGRDRIMCAFRE